MNHVRFQWLELCLGVAFLQAALDMNLIPCHRLFFLFQQIAINPATRPSS